MLQVHLADLLELSKLKVVEEMTAHMDNESGHR
jgi:hypothetical protein